jgi:hypothetical protein
MPNDTFEVRKFGKGFAVYGVKSGKRHSKKAMTKEEAQSQAKAIYASINSKKKGK